MNEKKLMKYITMENYEELFDIMKRFGNTAEPGSSSHNPDIPQIDYKFDLTDLKALKAILNAKNRVSPAHIVSLDEDEIIVRGRNKENFDEEDIALVESWRTLARKDRRRAHFAHSYDLPTVKFEAGELVSLKIPEIKQNVQKFINEARENPGMKYLVTRVGCGRSGYSDPEIAVLFAEALTLENVYLPQSFLDVLFGVVTPFDNPSQMVPSESHGIETFTKDLWRQLSYYMNWLREHKSRFLAVFADYEFLTIMDTLEILSAGIIKAVELSFRGLPASAYRAIEEILNENLFDDDDSTATYRKSIFMFNSLQRPTSLNINWKVALTPIEREKIFYRMRAEKDNMEKQKVDRKGMFHIGFSNRGIVKTQRYSVPGYPCLYLGERIYGCWVELGKPNLNDCLISKLRNDKQFHVLDLSIPEPEAWTVQNHDKLLQTILTFPLIIASTFKQHDPKAFFKPEYIVPQLLLQYVKEWAFKHNQKVRKQDQVVYGIRYTSVHKPKTTDTHEPQSSQDKNTYTNYVVPVVDIKNELCTKLADIFMISDPICEEFEMVRHQTGKHIFDSLEDILNPQPTDKQPIEDKYPCKRVDEV